MGLKSCKIAITNNVISNKRPRRKQRGIVTLFLTFHTPQGAGNLPVILLKKKDNPEKFFQVIAIILRELT